MNESSQALINTDKVFKKVSNSQAMKNCLNLAERWNDEKEYEDIEEYLPAVRRIFETDFPEANITKIYKKPFGFNMHINGGIFHIKIKLLKTKYDVSANVKKEVEYV